MSPNKIWNICVAVVQLLSCVRLFETSWTAARQAPLPFIISQSLLKLMSIELVMLPISSSATLFSVSLYLSSFGVFSNELALCIRWPKYQSFSFSISLSCVYSGLISFRTDWFGLLTLQGTLKSLI